MMNKNEKKGGKKSSADLKNKFYLIPLIGILLIVPLIVRLKIIELTPEVYLLWSGETHNPDFFSYYKGLLTIFFAVLSLVILFFTFGREERLRVKEDRFLYIAVGILMAGILLSTLFSPYKYLVFSGAPDRYEGVYVWTAYLLLLIYAMGYSGGEKESRILVFALYAFTLLIALIGITQFIGKDIFRSSFLLPWIVPQEYARYRDGFSVGEIPKTIYGTSYHYNYMGSLSALLLAFSLTMALLLRETKLRLLSFAAAGLSVFLLLGSGARSGLIGLLFYLLIFGILFFPKLIASKKRALLGLLVLLVAGGGFSLAFGRNLFERIPTLLTEVKQLFSSSDVDYREEIPLKEIRIEGENLKIQIDDCVLYFNNDKKEFRDENQNLIPYENREERILLSDERYEKFLIDIFPRVQAVGDGKVQNVLLLQYENLLFDFDITGRDIVMIDQKGRPVDLREAESIGFKGKERLGSARGYIWSRTLPKLLKSPILGYGPDSFLAIFPQGDLYARLYAYGEIWMLVDKPHNLYLNIALNFGLPALIVFLILILLQGRRIFRSYFRVQEPLQLQDVFGLACFMGVIAYLGAGFFNDSVLSVAPIFWVMLGLSIALTGKSGKRREKELTQKA